MVMVFNEAFYSVRSRQRGVRGLVSARMTDVWEIEWGWF